MSLILHFLFFYMYIYSLLITADVIASDNYNKSIKEIDFNKSNKRIDSNLALKIHNSFYEKDYNKYLKNRKFGMLNFNFDTNNINDLRTMMLLESSNRLLNSIKKHDSKRIFFP